MNISNSLINALAEEQTVEAVRPEDELRYSNYFADCLEMDFFAEDNETEVQNSRSKTEKAKQRKKVDLTK